MIDSPTSSDPNLKKSGTTAHVTLSEAVKDIWETEGPQGFFAGLLPRLGIVSIGGMFYFLAAAFVEQQF